MPAFALRSRSLGSAVRSRSLSSDVRSRSLGSAVRSRSLGSAVRSRSLSSAVRSRSLVSAVRSRSLGSALRSRSLGSAVRSPSARPALQPPAHPRRVRPRRWLRPPPEASPDRASDPAAHAPPATPSRAAGPLPERQSRRHPAGPMRTRLLPRALSLLSLLLLSSGHYAAGSDLNDTSSGKGEAFSGDHSAGGLEVSPVSEMPSGTELSTGSDYEYSEEYDNEPQIASYIVDGSVRVEQVIKPKKNRTESEKTTDKPKRKRKGGKNGKNRRNKKKKNPCDKEFQNFCIHGECKYIDNLEVATCKCHQDYFGERCGEKSMKTHSLVDSDVSKIALAAIAAFVSAASFTAIAVVITIQLRKRYLREFEGEAEERKKLRQENGNTHITV